MLVGTCSTLIRYTGDVVRLFGIFLFVTSKHCKTIILIYVLDVQFGYCSHFWLLKSFSLVVLRTNNCKITFSLNIISYNVYCILIKMFIILVVYKYRITYHNDTINSLHESNSNRIYSSIVIDCCVYPFCNCSCELGF